MDIPPIDSVPRPRFAQVLSAILAVPFLTLFAPLPSCGVAQAQVSESTQILLSALVINGREVGALDLIPADDGYLVPLDRFVSLTQLELADTPDNQITLTTPLGTVTFAATEIQEINGVRYIRDSFLAERIATPLTYDPSELALIADLPWQLGARLEQLQLAPLQPEVRPTDRFLSNFRQDLFYTDREADEDLRSVTTLNGRLLGGNWRVRLDQDFEDDPDLEEAFLRWRFGQSALLVGLQDLHLHPLLDNLDFTGVQYGWSNLTPQQLRVSSDDGALYQRQINARRSFSGEGPPAGLAQLRIDGTVRAQQRIDLQGRYRFENVPLSSSRLTRIEILIFERDNFTTPVEIQEQSLNLADALLPANGVTRLAGIGESSGELVGLLQERRGLSKNFTLEATAQQTPDFLQLQTGLIWQPLPVWTLGMDVALSDEDQVAYAVSSQAEINNVRIEALSEQSPAGFRTINQPEEYDHLLDVQVTTSPRLRLGLIARSRLLDEDESRFILPTFSWRPGTGNSVIGRPDADGSYQVNGRFSLSPQALLGINISESSNLDFNYQFTERYSFGFTQEIITNDDEDSRTTAQITRSGLRRSEPTVTLGVTAERGELGLLVSGDVEVIPGILASLRYETLSRQEREGDVLALNLSTAFSVTDSGLVAGTATNPNLGTLSGRLILIDPPRRPLDLEDIQLLVLGRGGFNRRARTDSGGGFNIPNLEPDVYQLQLDPADLPFEVTPERLRVLVEVAEGAVTSFDFPLQVLYGLAGQVRDPAGEPLVNVRVQVVDPEDNIVGRGRTDAFGFYRIDGIAAGTYQVRLNPMDLPEGAVLPEQTVDLVDDFLFDQDLQLQ